VPEDEAAGLLDTSVIIDLNSINASVLPAKIAISTVSLAEIAAGPAATDDVAERARRQDRLQRVEATFEPIPFDGEAARAYGRIYAAVVAVGRKPRRRLADLQIAATALANDMTLITRKPDYFVGLDDLIRVVAV
jgi:predicted nucleic acid-binding protein